LKTLWLIVLLLGSCASWKQKDFEKDLEKDPEVKTVITEKQAPILEKFEVTDVKETPAPVVKKKQKAVTQKKAPAPKKTVVPPIKTPEPKLVKSPPADYPAEMIAANEKAKKVWDVYKSNHNHHVNEKIYLDIHYLGMTVGKIMVTNMGKKMIDDKEVWHLHARFKSAPFYSSIYELDDAVDTYVTTDKFLSVKYTVI
jgi:hypothetical protein